MNKKIFIDHPIPDRGFKLLQAKGYEVVMDSKDHIRGTDDVSADMKGKNYDALLTLLSDKIDAKLFDAAGPQLKIVANYAVGYDNIDIIEAKRRGIMVTNTPDVLNESVAEHTFALMLSIAHRIVEADKFMRAGKFQGWMPKLLLGTDLSHKILGVVGLGRIGQRVVENGARGFNMSVIYHDIKRNEDFEKEFNAVYKDKIEDLLKEADFISLHVPLLPSTKHLIDANRLNLMKNTAYLINTSRGPVIDEKALVEALEAQKIKGAALDVFENEPEMAKGLSELDNVIVTPHIASATEETRQKMSETAAKNIIAALEGKTPPNLL